MRVLALAFALLLASAARAEHRPAPVAHVGVHTGLVFPQLASELGAALGIEVDGGVRVWRRLSAWGALGYSQPSVEHSGRDPRLPGDGAFATSTRQRELTLTLGALFRLRPAGARLSGYVAAGLRAWLLETITNGGANGQPFQENRETSTRWGGVVASGVEMGFGRGAAVGEVSLAGSDLPHLITGDVDTTAIGVTVGFRLFF